MGGNHLWQSLSLPCLTLLPEGLTKGYPVASGYRRSEEGGRRTLSEAQQGQNRLCWGEALGVLGSCPLAPLLRSRPAPQRGLLSQSRAAQLVLHVAGVQPWVGREGAWAGGDQGVGSWGLPCRGMGGCVLGPAAGEGLGSLASQTGGAVHCGEQRPAERCCAPGVAGGGGCSPGTLL